MFHVFLYIVGGNDPIWFILKPPTGLPIAWVWQLTPSQKGSPKQREIPSMKCWNMAPFVKAAFQWMECQTLRSAQCRRMLVSSTISGWWCLVSMGCVILLYRYTVIPCNMPHPLRVGSFFYFCGAGFPLNCQHCRLSMGKQNTSYVIPVHQKFLPGLEATTNSWACRWHLNMWW